MVFDLEDIFSQDLDIYRQVSCFYLKMDSDIYRLVLVHVASVGQDIYRPASYLCQHSVGLDTYLPVFYLCPRLVDLGICQLVSYFYLKMDLDICLLVSD